MISVLLTLLKIIGIVILSLLGLFLVLLLIVLFVPVRYRLKGYFRDEFVCHGKATWLLHFISVSFDYEKEFRSSIKILGIDISSFIKHKEDTSSNTKKKKTKEESSTVDKSDSKSETTDTAPDTTGQNNILENNADNDKTSDTIEDESIDSSKSIFQKINDFITGIKEKILSLYNKLLELVNKIKQTVANILTKKESLERYIQILKKEEVKSAFSLCKNRIFRMFKHLLPKKMKIHAHIGMEDPSTTGYILAFYSILPDKLRRQIILKADFDEVIMEADYNIKGYCNAFSFLYQLLCIIMNKNCSTFYKLVKKEISNERK